MKANTEHDHKGLDLKPLLSALKRRTKAFVATFVVFSVVSGLLIVLYPASYQSRSTILIEQQEIPQDLVRSTVTSFADQRIEVISQRVMTTSNLWDLIKKYDLYQDELRKDTRESVIQEMRNNAIDRKVISADVVDPRSGRPTQATIAFQLAFTYKDPKRAQKVANELTSLFLSENLKSRSEMAEQTSAFLESESAKLGERVTKLESQLAEFKENNFDSLPSLTNLNLSLLDRTEQSLLDNKRQQNLVEERIAFLRTELSQIDKDTPLLRGNGQLLMSNSAKLRSLNSELLQAQARYSSDHPSVKRLTDELESMMEIVGDREAPQIKIEIYERQYTALRQKYTDVHPDVVGLADRIKLLKELKPNDVSNTNDRADNPAYLQVKGQLETAMIEKAGLLERNKVLVADLNKYEQRITAAPRIEQEFQKLQRDYQSATLKYAEVKAKQQEAALGRSLETEQKGERFTLIEPPLVPESAHSPNRKLLFVLGAILTLGASIGIVFLLELIDPAIRGRKRLTEIVGAPPLVVIPYIQTDGELLRQSHVRIALGIALAVGVLSSLALFHVFVKPLDVTWYVALRKFGWM